MALIFMDGFDKYGGVNSYTAGVTALLTAGEWTSISSPGANIALGLSTTGYAFNMFTSTNILTKTLPGSYSRLIGGVRFNSNLNAAAGLQFIDAASNQCGICINVAGTFAVRTGVFNTGTILGTSTASVTANTTHHLEWDITFGNSANYQLWLDGTSILSGTGDTTATANNSASGISINGAVNAGATWDDFYLFDTTGTTNNAVLLTSPRIETQFPTSDGAVQFAVGAGILGTSISRATSGVSTAANEFRVKPVRPGVACTLTSITIGGGGAVGLSGVTLRAIVYADNGSNAPGSLLGSSATTAGPATGATVTYPLTASVALTAGTQYWIGFMASAVGNGGQATTVIEDKTGSATFASGAPSTAPSVGGFVLGIQMYGTVTVPAGNFYEVSQNPPQGSLSYVFDATVGHEDLYNFPALSAPPSAIYAVAVKASLSKSDAGAKTASVRLKSGATDSAGTGGTALAPSTSYGWMTSHYPTDPNTSAAWTLGGLNSAQAGVKVET